MQLTLILFSVVATSLAGAGVIAVLTMGYGTLMPILWAAATGLLLAIPVSYLIAKKIQE